jgi:hypothetical protein
MSMLSTARHIRSMRSPCSCRLHMRATFLSHVATMPRPVPLLSLGRRQALTPLCSPHHLPLPLLHTLPTAPATAVAVVRKHRSSAITPCHRLQEKSSACTTKRPTTLAISSSAWSSPWTVASGPPLVNQPTPRAPPGYHAPPRLVNRPPRSPYRPTTDVLPCFDYRHRGECYSGEPSLPDALQTGSPNRRASYSR